MIERLGKFHKVLEPGLRIVIPLLDRISYIVSFKEQAIDIPEQSGIIIITIIIILSIHSVGHLTQVSSFCV